MHVAATQQYEGLVYNKSINIEWEKKRQYTAKDIQVNL